MSVLTAIICLAAGAASAAYARRLQSRVRLMEQTPTSNMGELRPGFREIRGTVQPSDDVVKAPWSGDACVYFEFKVVGERDRPRHRTGKQYATWVTVVHDRQFRHCVLGDDTGRCTVDLERAELILDPDSHTRSGFLRDAPEELEGALQRRYGTSARGRAFNHAMRVEETVIKRGDRLYALGQVSGSAASGFTITSGGPLFLVSSRRESELLSGLKRRLMVAGLGAALAAAMGIGMALALTLQAPSDGERHGTPPGASDGADSSGSPLSGYRTHRPCWHRYPGEQEFPQIPQLAVSVSVLVQRCSRHRADAQKRVPRMGPTLTGSARLW